MIVEFAVNNKVHPATKVLSFIANYRRELRMGTDIRRKRKNRESNKVCGENEEDTRGGGSSIEKSTGRYEEVGR